MPTSPRSRLRRLSVLATGSWLARGYLALFALGVLVMFLFPESPYAMSPMVLTAPLSFLAVLLPFGPGTEGSPPVEVLATGLWFAWTLLCALVNAAALGALVRKSDRAPSVRPRPRAPRAPRTLLAPAVDNWLARGYLAVVAAALGTFLYAVFVSSDPGFAGIWPIMAAAPLSFLALLVTAPAEYSSLTWLSPLLFSVGVVLSGLVNAALIGLLAHKLRARPAGR
ncbi:SCO4225 family membrane protein [Streptomyces sp. NPDC059781]|uniref:SCO4225 family membrane protein n=1 Tax=Streptomyces sp. NPDC059781 TaxID=3346943 RepID=UPI0036527CD1